MPPCAHRVLPDCRLVFDTTVTRWPALARRNAQDRPAAPLPMTRTSASFMERSGREVGTMEDFARFDPAAAGTQVSVSRCPELNRVLLEFRGWECSVFRPRENRINARAITLPTNNR